MDPAKKITIVDEVGSDILGDISRRDPKDYPFIVRMLADPMADRPARSLHPFDESEIVRLHKTNLASYWDGLTQEEFEDLLDDVRNGIPLVYIENPPQSVP